MKRFFQNFNNLLLNNKKTGLKFHYNQFLWMTMTYKTTFQACIYSYREKLKKNIAS